MVSTSTASTTSSGQCAVLELHDMHTEFTTGALMRNTAGAPFTGELNAHAVRSRRLCGSRLDASWFRDDARRRPAHLDALRERGERDAGFLFPLTKREPSPAMLKEYGGAAIVLLNGRSGPATVSRLVS